MEKELKQAEKDEFQAVKKELEMSAQVLTRASSMLEEIDGLIETKKKILKDSEKILQDLRIELNETKQNVMDSANKFEDNKKKMKDPEKSISDDVIIPDIDVDDFMIKACVCQNKFKNADNDMHLLGEALCINQKVAAYENELKKQFLKYQEDLRKIEAVKLGGKNEIEINEKEINDLNARIANLTNEIYEKSLKVKPDGIEKEEKKKDNFSDEFIKRLKQNEEYAIKQFNTGKDIVLKELEDGKKEMDNLKAQLANYETKYNVILANKEKFNEEQALKILGEIENRLGKPQQENGKVQTKTLIKVKSIQARFKKDEN